MKEVTGDTVWKWFKDAIQYTKDWREEVRASYDFYASKQRTGDEESYLTNVGRHKITLNKISPTLDSIAGNQVNNRQEVTYAPVEEGDIKTNALMNGAYMWEERKCNGQFEVSDAFMDMLLAGIGVTNTRMDYDSDPKGRLITAERISPLEFTYDLRSVRRNLADSRYRQTWNWLDYEDAVEQWPKIKNIQIKALPDESLPIAIVTHPRDDYGINSYRMVYDRRKDSVQVMQTQYWKMVVEYVIVDPESGQETALSREDAARINLFESNIPYLPRKIKKFYQVFSVGNHIIEEHALPVNMFTLNAMTWKRDENDGTFYGIMRQMKDPQRWANKFISDIQDMLTISRKGGAYVESGATKDPERFERDFAKPGGILWLREGGLGKVQERAMGDYPVGLDRILQLCLGIIPEISGVNLEMLGLADRQQAGVLEAQRKQSAFAILAPAFDALSLHTLDRARICQEYIIKFMNDGRLVRVLGEKGLGQYEKLIFEPGVAKYDTFVDEAPRSHNVKEQVLVFLQSFMEPLLGMGINILPDTLDYMPIPEGLIQKLKEKFEAMQPTPEAQKAQQEMEALQKRGAEATVAKTEAEAEKTKVEAQTKPYEALNSLLS